MKSIADEIAIILIRRFIIALLLFAFLYFGIRSGIGLYKQHKTQVAQAQAYVADVQEVARWINDQKK